MSRKSELKVAFTIGLIHPRFSQSFPHLEGINPHKPTYMWTGLRQDLIQACQQKGWGTFVVKLGQESGPQTPQPDLVVNLISEPITQNAALGMLASFEESNAIPVINTADSILATARNTLAETLGGMERIIVPKTTVFNLGHIGIEEHVEANGHSWPVLLRPIGSHGGTGLTKINKGDPIPDGPAGPFWFLTDFFDYRDKDGLYIKRRAVWTGEAVIRRHMIVSDTWKVDGQSRIYMVDKDHLIDDERAFISRAHDELDERLSSLFRRTGLDFGLIDFALLEDESILVFELNSNLQVSGSIPPDKLAQWGYLEDSNARIVDSIVNSFERKYASLNL